MALTGLQIQKLLPKTNCKECGSNTCLAFAMKLAAKKADLAECPYASVEAKAVLGAAARPPMRTLALGPKKALLVGGETVLYRHDKTFVHQTALAVDFAASDPDLLAKAARVRDYVLVRVGEELRFDLIALTQAGLPGPEFAAKAAKVFQATQMPLIVRADDPQSLALAGAALAGSQSILDASALLAQMPPCELEPLVQAAKSHGHALALCAPDLDALAALAGRSAALGLEDIVLHLPAASQAARFQAATVARRAALKDAFAALGYPSLERIETMDPARLMATASGALAKYASILTLPVFDPALAAPLLTLRQNIYTDPQKPIQVEPGVYPIGEPDENSPVFVTTNFSLTFFLVSGEIENAGLSAWLAIPDCEGMSVLTAWAAGKFGGTHVAKFIGAHDQTAKLTKKVLVLPGYVSQIKGETEEGLPGWTVLVGPQEASDLESFAKARLGREAGS